MIFERLHRDAKGTVKYLEEVCARVDAFSRRFDLDGGPHVETIWQGFATKSPGLGLWAILDNNGDVIGHCYAGITTWEAKWTGWCYQAQMDEPATATFWKQCERELERWAAQWNETCQPHMRIMHIHMVTPHDTKAMERLTTFVKETTVMRTKLKGVM